jgi:hypothetical protein
MDSELPSLLARFEKMRLLGFDVTKTHKWGFFFLDPSREKLLEVVSELEGHDYVVRELRQGEDLRWVLQVEKIQSLDPEGLHRRNVAFNELAAYTGIELYDGWDVENA